VRSGVQSTYWPTHCYRFSKVVFLLARKGNMFLYYEHKTDKMHMIKSKRLAEPFDSPGIRDEVLIEHADTKSTTL